ncbi:MAG TPA: biotin/lipoyl-containing protein, partial [Longimicrobium sp.]|nr:biotin/lipoyl-containing protein [Longimicrobium sp.]
MPQMGESIAEGTVSVWLKKVGDKVERDEPIMEIATDKVDAEIPSPAAGILTEVVVQEGETVEVGTIVAYIETDVTAAAGAAASAPAPAAAGEPAAGVPGETATTLPEASVGQPETGGGAGAPADGRSPAEAAPMAPAHEGGPETAEDRLRRKSTPLVRKIAAEHGVEVSAVTGTGRAGRVT